MNTSAPGDQYCFTMESAIARHVHATAAATAALEGDQAKVVVEQGLKECLGNYRDNKRASTNNSTRRGGNNCDGAQTESNSAAPRNSAAKAIEQLANLDLLDSSSSHSAITDTTKRKPEKDSHKKLQSAIQNLSDHVDDTLNKTGTKNSHNKTNGNYSSDEDSLEDPPERRRTSAFISCLAEKIPDNVEKKFGSKQQQEFMHQSLPHLDAADIKEYLLGGSVHRAKNTMAKDPKGQRQTTHKQREMAHFLNASFTRHDSNDDDNANNSNINTLDQSWTELFEKGAESKAATEAALKVMGTATMLEKLGKSPRLLREITAELAGFGGGGGGGGDGSVSSIHTFDLHNLSHGDNLLVVPSDDEGREEDQVNIDTSDEGENGAVQEQEQGGPLDIDIDIDVEDTKNKKKLKKKILKKKPCGHKNKKTEGSSKSKSPPRTSGKQKQQPKGTPSNGSNLKSCEDSGDPGFFSQFPDFEEDPFAQPFDDPFADEIIAEAAPFRRSATTPVPTSTSGGSSNGQGFRRAGTRDQILARKKNIVGTGRSRARPGRIRDGNKTDINFAAYSAANQNGGDGDTIGQGDDDTATQSATNSDAGLEAKLGQLKKKTLKRGPSVSTVIANKIRSNPDLLEQFLDMVKDDQTFHAALECGTSGPSPLTGMDASGHAKQRSADIKPGTYRSMFHGGDAASVASSVVSGATPIGPNASNGRRSRRNRVSISEAGITRPEPGAGGATSPQQAPEPSALERRRGRHAMQLMEESTRKKIGGESY